MKAFKLVILIGLLNNDSLLAFQNLVDFGSPRQLAGRTRSIPNQLASKFQTQRLPTLASERLTYDTTKIENNNDVGNRWLPNSTNNILDKKDMLTNVHDKSSTHSIAQMKQDDLIRKIKEFRYRREGYGSLTENDEIRDSLTIEDFVRAVEGWEKYILENANKKGLAGSGDAIDSVMTIYKSLNKLYLSTKIPSLRPDENIFRVVLRTLASSRERGVDRLAWKVFKHMEDHMVSRDPCIYHSMISMSAKSRERGAANRAESLLREAVSEFPPSLDGSGMTTGMTIDSFNVVLTAWAKSGVDYGPERAEKLIAFIEEVDGGRGVIKPSVSSFTSLIDAYAQTNEWESVSRGERIFNRVLDMYLDGDDSFEPSIVSWTIMINAWARLSKRGNRGAAGRANKLLRRMEELSDSGRIGFKPDAIVYVTCLNANAFSKTREGAQAAQDILDEMHERYMDGEDSFMPTIKSVKIVAEAWIRVDDMEAAESLLDIYNEHLNVILDLEEDEERSKDISEIYKSMIFGWAKNGNPTKAEEVLYEMIERGLAPDSFCFDRVIEANTQSNDAGAMKRSYNVFKRMESCQIRGEIKPNERVYTSFIRAMARAQVPGRAKKSRLLLRRMETLFKEGNKGIKPTVFTYNAIFMACSESSPKQDNAESKEALKVALELFGELREMVEGPDHVTFGNMLRCANLIPNEPQKDAFVSSVFQLCCKQGLVNQFVLRDLKQSASDTLWESIFKCTKDVEISINRIPESWKYALTQ